MDNMRGKGKGTWDRANHCWQLKKHKLRRSPAQLQEAFGEPVPNTKEGSRPFWNRFLTAFYEARVKLSKTTTHVPNQVASLETLIQQFEAEGRDASVFKKALDAILALPEYDRLYPRPEHLEHADVPVPHPDDVEALTLSGNLDNEIIVAAMNASRPKPIPKEESLYAEGQAYIERQKAKNHKGHYEIRTVVNLFLQATGRIKIKEITVEHYRKFLDLLAAQGKSETTEINRQRALHTWLKRIEADHNIVFGFIRNPDYKRETPEGEKIQYTLEQVQTALCHATGTARTALLLGLNCGFYWGDIVELNPEAKNKDGSKQFDGIRIKKGRAKNKRKKKFIGNWLLWPETIRNLQFGLSKKQLESAYNQFRSEHDLPEHMALRKSMAQWIQDLPVGGGDEVARCYRAEKGLGTHHKNYITFSPAQVAKLDAAILAVGRMLGL